MTETTTARPNISLGQIVLDTPDPKGLAEFYSGLLGWKIVDESDDWVTIRGESGTELGFQLAIAYTPPTWPEPDVPQQFHLDFSAADVDAAGAYATAHGATFVHDARSEGSGFVVYLDPTGHPFCLCQ